MAQRNKTPTCGFVNLKWPHGDGQDSWLPDGQSAGTPETGLDTAAGLYLADPTAWT